MSFHQQQILALNQTSNPFPNLLLVSLIILGFCVFVAWYAKKNQLENSDDGMGRRGNDDSNGYLWGLNKENNKTDNINNLSPSSEDNMMDNNTQRPLHKKKFDKKIDEEDIMMLMMVL